MADDWFEKAFGAHYPALYAHRDEAEAVRCLELLPRLAPLFAGRGDSGAKVLDLGCGDGRHLQKLAACGTSVVGLDLSAELLKIARGRTSNALLVRGDMRRLPFGDGSFDSVLSLFTAFGYFGAVEDSRPVVERIAGVLAPGGHWFLDYLDCDRVRAELDGRPPVRREREVGPLRVTETKRLSPNADRVVKKVEILPAADRRAEALDIGIPAGGTQYEEQVALFSIEEMDRLADAADLWRVNAAGGYSGEKFGEGDRWILVYRRGARPRKE